MAYDYDFSERMDTGRQVAMDRRNKGLPVGKPAKGWTAKRPRLEKTDENMMYCEMADLRVQLRDAQNTIAALKLSGNDPDDFGAEFDRLAAGGIGVPPALSSPAFDGPRGLPEARTMTNRQYILALKKLGLSRASKRTADLLGVKVRHIQRIAADQTPVPTYIALLLNVYLDHGLPAEDD